jgi:hypothetical protein
MTRNELIQAIFDEGFELHLIACENTFQFQRGAEVWYLNGNDFMRFSPDGESWDVICNELTLEELKMGIGERL